MGKRLFQQLYVSPERTKALALPALQVVSELDESDSKENTYHAVSATYFTKEKAVCPVCKGTHTVETKIFPHKFKDLLPGDAKKPKVIDLIYHQRYFRCLDCPGVVFHEKTDFAEDGCKFTNRLSDMIAEGTLTRTYEKVCKEYGVPASKASVGIIMRRRMRLRAESQPPQRTPETITIFNAEFFSGIYPMVLGNFGRDVRLLDVLNESSITAYRQFFQQFDRKTVKQVFIDPDEQMHSAVVELFPQAEIMVSEEYIRRCARDALKDVIRNEGNHCVIHRRYDTLTAPEHQLSEGTHRRAMEGMKKLPRVRAAYTAYQELLRRMDVGRWKIETLKEWINALPEYLQEEQSEGEQLEALEEFGILDDVLTHYEPLIQTFLDSEKKPPASVASAVIGILDAIEGMPYCIYDVLRARMMANVEQEQVEIDGQMFRTGVRIEQLTEKMNEIAWQIRSKKEREEYGGYDTED